MNDKIQHTQEALVKAHMRTISALRASLKELHGQGLIRPFRVSLAVSQEQDEEIKRLAAEGQSVRQIAAKTGVARSSVSDRTKKTKKNNGSSVRPDTPRQTLNELMQSAFEPHDARFGDCITAAHCAAEWTNVTKEIVSAAEAVAQAWRETADHLARQLKEDDNG